MNSLILVGEALHITGYGKTKQTIFNHNTKLNFGTVHLWGKKECLESPMAQLFPQYPITDENYCAGPKSGSWGGSCATKVLG